jgi:hypothetical protein
MKKLVLLALVAFACLAVAKPVKSELPFPQCNPCPFVR